MARATITSVTISLAGYNLTDSASFTTLSTGAGNGVDFVFNASDIVFLKNDTGGGAVFTITVPTPSTMTSRTTVNDDTVSVATGKTYVMKLNSIYKNTDGSVYIDCDVAGKVLVMNQ